MDRPGHADSILFNYLLHSYLHDHYLGDCPVEVDQYCFLVWWEFNHNSLLNKIHTERVCHFFIVHSLLCRRSRHCSWRSWSRSCERHERQTLLREQLHQNQTRDSGQQAGGGRLSSQCLRQLLRHDPEAKLETAPVQSRLQSTHRDDKGNLLNCNYFLDPESWLVTNSYNS